MARIRYGLVWMAFIACMLTGAALVTAGDGALWWGLGLLLTPLIVLGGASGLYYARQRRV